MTNDTHTYDVIVVGGGISGVIFLKYAVEAGLTCLLLEKQKEVGGIWNRLPRWQEIQITKEEWSLNDVPIAGIRQSDILDNVRSWVKQFDLLKHIKTNHGVQSTRFDSGKWSVATSQGTFQSRHLVVASGIFGKPVSPTFKSTDSRVQQWHSCQFKSPETLEGKRVCVVGGNASALDLLDLAVQYGASEIHWIYRSVRWFVPTTRAKDAVARLRFYGWDQFSKGSSKTLSENMQTYLNQKYDYFDVNAIKPASPFDYDKDVLIPGRAHMLRAFKTIKRHVGEIESLKKHTLTCTNGDTFEVDRLLHGTGYRLDLTFLGLEKLTGVDSREKLMKRCGYLARSVDYPNLFFVGHTLTDNNTSVPFSVAVLSKTVVSHILGKCEIPLTPITHLVNYWDLIKLFAPIDRRNYLPGWWKLKYRFLAWWYLKFKKKLVRV